MVGLIGCRSRIYSSANRNHIRKVQSPKYLVQASISHWLIHQLFKANSSEAAKLPISIGNCRKASWFYYITWTLYKQYKLGDLKKTAANNLSWFWKLEVKLLAGLLAAGDTEGDLAFPFLLVSDISGDASVLLSSWVIKLKPLHPQSHDVCLSLCFCLLQAFNHYIRVYLKAVWPQFK